MQEWFGAPEMWNGDDLFELDTDTGKPYIPHKVFHFVMPLRSSSGSTGVLAANTCAGDIKLMIPSSELWRAELGEWEAWEDDMDDVPVDVPHPELDTEYDRVIGATTLVSDGGSKGLFMTAEGRLLMFGVQPEAPGCLLVPPVVRTAESGAPAAAPSPQLGTNPSLQAALARANPPAAEPAKPLAGGGFSFSESFCETLGSDAATLLTAPIPVAATVAPPPAAPAAASAWTDEQFASICSAFYTKLGDPSKVRTHAASPDTVAYQTT
jgi:hypothetical protein